jgi:predicted lipid-binding transport protein (Tim44 family)
MKIRLQRLRRSLEIVPIRITANWALRPLSKIGAVLLVSLLGVVVCAAQNQGSSDQESVAKVARPKSVRKAKVVITNDDLPSRPESTPETSVGSPANGAAAAQNQAAQQSKQNIPLPGLPPGATIDQAREALESLKREERVMVGRYDEIQHKLAETNDQSLHRLYSDSLSRRDETLARKRKQIEEAERAIRLATEAGSTQGGNNAAK